MIEPIFCGSRLSTGRLLAIEDFYLYLFTVIIYELKFSIDINTVVKVDHK